MKDINDPDAGHGRGTVDESKAFPDMHFNGFQPHFLKYISSWLPFIIVMYFPFTDKDECEVGKLDEVATGTNTTMFGNKGVDIAVDELFQEIHDFRVDAGMGLDDRVQPGQHGGFDIYLGEGIAQPGAMAPDQVIL